MGEWSDFFEDFPEEDPANWIKGVYTGPRGAQLQREHQVKFDAARTKVAAEQNRLNSTIAKIIAAGIEREKLNKNRD
jgi:hypothetical protein